MSFSGFSGGNERENDCTVHSHTPPQVIIWGRSELLHPPSVILLDRDFGIYGVQSYQGATNG